jgi:hypothetical protein
MSVSTSIEEIAAALRRNYRIPFVCRPGRNFSPNWLRTP